MRLQCSSDARLAYSPSSHLCTLHASCTGDHPRANSLLLAGPSAPRSIHLSNSRPAQPKSPSITTRCKFSSMVLV